MASIIRPLLWTGLFTSSLIVPDPIPFADEIALGAAAMNSWNNYFDDKRAKRYYRQQEHDRQYGMFPGFKKIFKENQTLLLILAIIIVYKIQGVFL